MSKDESKRPRRCKSSRTLNSHSSSGFDSKWSYKSTQVVPLPTQQLQRLLKLKFNHQFQGSAGDKFPIKDIELSADLVGVKAAISVLRPYELCVGIELPSMTATSSGVWDISREVDQAAVALNHKKWRELMEELSRPIDVDDVRKTSVGSVGKVAVEKFSAADQNISLLPGLDLASWGNRHTSLPSTPRPKLRPLVICTPRGGTRSCTLTPCAGRNDAVVLPSSLSPAEIAAELSELKRSPTPPLSLSFSSESTDSSPKSIAASPSPSPLPDFVFPSLTSRPVPRKIHLEKDDQGFFTGFEDDHSHHLISTTGLLPPFLVEEMPRRKTNQSRTRSIVDRLKKRASKEEVSKPQPSPQPQPKVMEEGDGWTSMRCWEPYQPDHSRAEKQRELFLATKKQQHDSEENNIHQKCKKKDASSFGSRSSISIPNNSHNDGWIEFKQPPPPRHHSARSRSQNNKRHSHSHSSVSHSPIQPPPQTAPAAYTAFRPPPLPPLRQPQLQPQPQPQPQPQHPAYYYSYPYPHQYAAAAYPQVQPQPHPYATTYSMALPTVPITPVPVPGSVPGPLLPATTTIGKHPGYGGFMGRAPMIGYPAVW